MNQRLGEDAFPDRTKKGKDPGSAPGVQPGGKELPPATGATDGGTSMPQRGINMKVFIGWSGERSQQLAQILRDWIPLVLHYVQPWMSETDIGAGTRWADAVAKELQESNFGIICVTRENVGSPWVLFEAGALAKSMEESRVIPLLLDLDLSDITGPLAQFQAKKVEQAGIGEVVYAINEAAKHEVPETRARELFEALWPKLEGQLSNIPKQPPAAKHARPQAEILEELVEGVRSLDLRIRDVDLESPRSSRRRLRHFYPELAHEMMHLSDEMGEPVGILVMASTVRDELPWLYDITVDTYRVIRSGDRGMIEREIRRWERLSELVFRGPFVEEFMFSGKDNQVFAMEFPRLVLELLHRRLEEKRPSVRARGEPSTE